MPFVTHGLPGGGRTPHFNLFYDDAAPVDGREAAAALQGMCDDDYDLLSRWFADVSIEPIDVGVSTAPTGASVGAARGVRGDVTIHPGPRPSAGRIRYLFVAEVSKRFMRAQDRGWLDAEGRGQGLSLARFLGAQALAVGAMGAPDLDLQPANAWMQSAREDFLAGQGDGSPPGTATIPDHPDNPWPIGHLADDLVDEDELPIMSWNRPFLPPPYV